MVLRVKPTLTRFPTKSLYTPIDNTPLHSLSSVCHPWGDVVVVGYLTEMLAMHALHLPYIGNGGLSVRLNSRVIRFLDEAIGTSQGHNIVTEPT